MKTFTLASTLALAASLAAPGLAKNDEHKNNHRFAGVTEPIADCYDRGGEDIGDIITTGDETLWPPNHKYAPYAITAETNGGASQAEVVWSTLTHDEYVTGVLPEEPGEADNDEDSEQNGSGNTVDDGRPFYDDDDNADGSAVTFHEIRAERSGRGDGREYTFRVWADFDDDDDQDWDCRGDFVIDVPHDMGQGAENKNVHDPEDG